MNANAVGAIPTEMKAAVRWINWCPVPDRSDPKKMDKLPVDPRTGQIFEKGSNYLTDLRRWVSFEEIATTGRPIGFVLGHDVAIGRTFSGLDLDACVDKGAIAPWAQSILRPFPTYAEISPSGTGLKAFLFGALPAPIRKIAGIELYDRQRFFTVTGQVIGEHTNVTDQSKRFRELYDVLNAGELLELFEVRGLIDRRNLKTDGFVPVICPWAAEHSKGSATSSTALHVTEGKVDGFKCLHAHCVERTIGDVRKWFGLKLESGERPTAKSLEAAIQNERNYREAKRVVDAEQRGPVPTLSSVAGDALKEFAFPLRDPLLCRGETVILRAGHLAEVFAERGIGKTWLLMTIALLFATGGTVLGLTVIKRRRVLYIDGEMASYDIRDRFVLLSERCRMPLSDHLVIVGADWQLDYLPRLDTSEGQQAIAPFIDMAEVVMIDNRSCLFDPEGEKDASAFQPAGDWLLSLRKTGKAVLLAHHANRNGEARGHSKAEDPMDLILKLSRPEDYEPEQGARFRVEFRKGRGIYGIAAAPFVAALTAKGWVIETPDGDSVDRKLREYLRVADEADQRPTSASMAISRARVNKRKGLAAWAALRKSGELKEHPDGGFHLVQKGAAS